MTMRVMPRALKEYKIETKFHKAGVDPQKVDIKGLMDSANTYPEDEESFQKYMPPNLEMSKKEIAGLEAKVIQESYPEGLKLLQKNAVLTQPKPVEELQKEITWTINNMVKLLNISCKSAKCKTLLVENKNGIERNERAVMHVFLHAPYGHFKSTIFSLIAEHYQAKTLTDCSFPKLVGSYDVQQRTLIPSAVWTHRNQTIIFDEFLFRKGIINALLQLLESGEYSRGMARSLPRENRMKDEDLYFEATTDGEISVKTRFNAIIGTMHDVTRTPHVTYDALISRCVPVFYHFSVDGIKDVVEGKTSLFWRMELPSEPLGRIEWEQVEYLMYFLDAEHVDETVYARTLGDLMRTYNILGKHDEELYRFVIKQKTYLPNVRMRSFKRHYGITPTTHIPTQ